MKRIVLFTVLVALAAGWSIPLAARDTGSTSDHHSEKSAQEQQTALYKYQKKQEKAQQKAQRASDKQQRKAAKKYEKQQRQLLKNANRPAKHAS